LKEVPVANGNLTTMATNFHLVLVVLLRQMKEGLWQLGTTGIEVFPSLAIVYYPAALSAVS
jgi:hypothetical protein